MRKRRSSSRPVWGSRLIWAGVLLLIILRQDLWFWNDGALVLGILPIGLAWHVGLSIAAALLWLAATRIAWPADEVYPPSGTGAADDTGAADRPQEAR